MSDKTYNQWGEKRCSRCKRYRHIGYFGKCKTHKDGLSYICIECRRSKQTEVIENNYKSLHQPCPGIKIMEWDKFLKTKLVNKKPNELHNTQPQ